MAIVQLIYPLFDVVKEIIEIYFLLKTELYFFEAVPVFIIINIVFFSLTRFLIKRLVSFSEKVVQILSIE